MSRIKYPGILCGLCGQPMPVGIYYTWNRTKDCPKNKRFQHYDCHYPEQEPSHLGTATTVSTVPASSPESNSLAGNAVHALAEAIGKDLEQRNKVAFEALAEEIDTRIELAIEQLPKTSVLQIEVKRSDESIYKVDGVHKQFETVLRLAQKRKNIYLWDGVGGGKSHVVPQIAKALDIRYATESFNQQTPDYKITGFLNAQGGFNASIFYDFWKNGGVYCGEELDDGSADLLVTINVPLANGHCTFANGEVVERHPDFVFIGCGNTPGRGPTPRYPERKPFDAAFANRLFFVRWEYDEGLEEQIALAINPQAMKYVQWVRKAREAVTNLALRVELTPRTTFFLSEISLDSHFTQEMLIDGILAGLDSTAKSKLLANCPFPS